MDQLQHAGALLWILAFRGYGSNTTGSSSLLEHSQIFLFIQLLNLKDALRSSE